jgi:hypothetical protein
MTLREKLQGFKKQSPKAKSGDEKLDFNQLLQSTPRKKMGGRNSYFPPMDQFVDDGGIEEQDAAGAPPAAPTPPAGEDPLAALLNSPAPPPAADPMSAAPAQPAPPPAPTATAPAPQQQDQEREQDVETEKISREVGHDVAQKVEKEMDQKLAPLSQLSAALETLTNVLDTRMSGIENRIAGMETVSAGQKQPDPRQEILKAGYPFSIEAGGGPNDTPMRGETETNANRSPVSGTVDREAVRRSLTDY